MAFCYPELSNDIHGAGACEETAISDLLDKIDNRRLENLTMEVVNRNLDLVPNWASEFDLSQKIDSKVMRELVKDIINRTSPTCHRFRQHLISMSLRSLILLPDFVA